MAEKEKKNFQPESGCKIINKYTRVDFALRKNVGIYWRVTPEWSSDGGAGV